MSNTIEVALVKELCPICGKEIDGPIIINSYLTEDDAKKVKDLHGKVVGFSEIPCNKCQANLEKAFLFIGYNEELSDMKDLPGGFYRTGHIIGTKKDIPLVQEFVKKHNPEAIKKGFIFMPYTIMEQFGLIKL